MQKLSRDSGDGIPVAAIPQGSYFVVDLRRSQNHHP